MNKTAVFLILVLLASCSGGAIRREDEKTLIHLTSALVTRLNDMVKEGSGRAEGVREIVHSIRLRILAGELDIVIDRQDARDIADACMFEPGNGNTPAVIRISPSLVTLGKEHRSLQYSLLVREFARAWQYFRNPDIYNWAMHNEAERYLYDMDAATVLAGFITGFSLPAGLSLSPYEKLVADSYRENKLAYYSLVFHSIDMNLAYSLCDMVNSTASAAEKRLSLIERGQSLLSSWTFPAGGNEWQRYTSIIPLHTYLIFAPHVYHRLKRQSAGSTGDTDGAMKDLLARIKNLVSDRENILEDFQNRVRRDFLLPPVPHAGQK